MLKLSNKQKMFISCFEIKPTLKSDTCYRCDQLLWNTVETMTHMEFLEFEDKGILNGLQLSWNDRQHGHINTVKLVKASPSTTLTQSRVDLSHSLSNKTEYSSNQVIYICKLDSRQCFKYGVPYMKCFNEAFLPWSPYPLHSWWQHTEDPGPWPDPWWSLSFLYQQGLLGHHPNSWTKPAIKQNIDYSSALVLVSGILSLYIPKEKKVYFFFNIVCLI